MAVAVAVAVRVALGASLAWAGPAGAIPPSIEDFASRAAIEDVSISPDGHYIALIQPHDGRGAAVVLEREVPHPEPRVVLVEPDHFHMTWCHWATGTRLLCGFRGMVKSTQTYAITRLVAVDADGTNRHILVQNTDNAQGQFQDRIISWHPGPADTVLVEADEGLSAAQLASGAKVYGNVGTHALPAVFELNVVTGILKMREPARDPIRSWIADQKGQVRLGWGLSGTTISYYARLSGDSGWRRLSKFEVFTRARHFDPIAISADDPNKAYAFGSFEGRRALWLIDLTDQDDPTVVFAHPAVDVGSPLFAPDGRLLGVRYETNQPMMYFTDARTASISQALKKIQPEKFTVITGSTRDESVFVSRSYSDLEASSFMVTDIAKSTSLSLGAAYPHRDAATLGTMRSISYPARDGTSIPAYLSTPPGPSAQWPLVVMPHGGPIARDSWGYFFLRQFLVSRGYAVLQMNFRGSSGYGDDWFFAAHQDWGGLTYDDVVDGARWAIAQKIADPGRLCIVGWSFGGYIALLADQRDAELFRCSVDIAGVSDLGKLIDERHFTLSSDTVRQQIGTDPEKLKRNSPRLHAAEFNAPLLMLHGDADAQVPFAQSTAMDDALNHAHKPHRFVAVPDADHQFSEEKDRALLLHEIEGFLAEHLAAGAATVQGAPAATPAAPQSAATGRADATTTAEH